jgi:predicted outer membrane repeat protein
MVNNTSAPVITNCSFIGNQSTISGGGMYNFNASPVIINCSFSGNQAATSGGAIYNNYISVPTISNSIFYGNSSEIFNAGFPSVVTYSIIQGGYAGTGNLDVNPQFVQQPPVGLGITGNLRLQNCSPAQDAGNDAANAGTSDFDGNPRKFNGNARPNDIDMGAYEIQSICCPPANILYVKANATGSNSGSSWANAYTSLQDALAQTSLCASVTQIWVAAGTYKPTTGTNRSISFAMKNNLAIYGGFAGTETLLAERNWNNNITILSGDIGAAGNPSDNSLHVIANSNLDATAIIDGFQISNGNANANDDVNESGGGVWNAMASPTFSNCVFSVNLAGFGGAMANQDNSSPVITNCIFIKNSATLGGAVYNTNQSSPNITFSRFSGNRANYSGGAINNRTNASPVVTNCVFIGNSANLGGALDNNGQSSPIITNCSFSGNVSDQASGAAIYNTQSSPQFTNCIIWGNTAAIVNEFSASPVVNYSIVQGGYGGTGNLDTDPQFVQQPPIIQGTAGDLRLQPCSPAQDAGNDAANTMTTDFAGYARKFNGKGGSNDIDMGAYELQTICCPPADILYVNANATGANNGSSWANAFTSLQDALAHTNLCGSVNQLWVAAGTYKPTTGTDRTISFVMKNNLGIYGGFAGSETQLVQRNWNTNLCILSGDIGESGNFVDNSYHVVRNLNNGLDTTAVLDGFSISGGNGNDVVEIVNSRGGGIYNQSASPVISNCYFSGNRASSGGAIFNANASPYISSCTFSSNMVTGAGGAVCNTVSTVSISNCNFSGNQSIEGGALYFWKSSCNIINCSFSGNTATNRGGGIYSYNTPYTITNCSFSGNQAETGGGLYTNGDPFNCLVMNCIVYGNSNGNITKYATANTSVSYSIVQGGYTGTGNLNIDPMFVQQPPAGLGTTGNLRLLPCSPAINMGNDMDNGTPIDLDNNNRKFGTIDMGAYERQTAIPIIWYLDSAATGNGDGTSWANAFTNLGTALSQLKHCSATDTLFIAKGTYQSNVPFEFDKLQGVILGGYPTGGGTRNAVANPVIVQGVVNVRKSMRIDGLQVTGQQLE